MKLEEYVLRYPGDGDGFMKLVSGNIVPCAMEPGWISPSDTGRPRRVLRLPDGTIYTNGEGLWVHTILGCSEGFKTSK